MNFYKKQVRLFFYCLLIFITLFSLIIYIRDPYMVFHKPYTNKMSNDLRIQNYGIIKYINNFDSVIIGTSMLLNTSANEATQKIKYNNEETTFANLSVPGLLPYERYIILKYLFSKRKIKNVISSFDLRYLNANKYKDTFYPDLYNNLLSGKFGVYSNFNSLKCVFLNKCSLIDIDLNYPINNINKDIKCLNAWLKYPDLEIDRFINNTYDLDIYDYKESIDNEIIPLVIENKDTDFYIIISPYSLYFFDKRFNQEIENVLDYYFSKTKNLKNLKTYWFFDEPFIEDECSYFNFTHYTSEINSFMLNSIRDNKNIINYGNYKKKMNKFKKRIDNFHNKKQEMIERIKKIQNVK